MYMYMHAQNVYMHVHVLYMYNVHACLLMYTRSTGHRVQQTREHTIPLWPLLNVHEQQSTWKERKTDTQLYTKACIAGLKSEKSMQPQ